MVVEIADLRRFDGRSVKKYFFIYFLISESLKPRGHSKVSNRAQPAHRWGTIYGG